MIILLKYTLENFGKRGIDMDSQRNNRYDMPIGLSFQLGLNEKALTAYAQMDDAEKRQVVEAARNVTSKAEMQQLVAGLERNFC